MNNQEHVIEAFKGKYFFLSNFYNIPVTYNGITYRNNEAAFQAQKQLTKAKDFAHLSASEAKRLGRRVHLREDWEEVKCEIMYDICTAKFTQNKKIAQLLQETGDAILIEGNTWGDRYWGMVNGVGRNMLGHILMRVRVNLRD